MTVEQKETLLQAAIMIDSSAKIIETGIFSGNDAETVDTLELTLENLHHQINDVKGVINQLKQSQL